MSEQKELNKKIEKILGNRSPTVINNNKNKYVHSAVLVPLFQDNGIYKVLFTKRTDNLEHHKGQISFPGGAVEEEDETYLDTALRESYEEIGLHKKDVRILGRIDDRLTLVSSFVIHPYVGVIPYPYGFQINRKEVERIIEVPLKLFFSGTREAYMNDVEYEGKIYHGPSYYFQGDVIWGATAGIMTNLMGILGKHYEDLIIS